MKYPHWVTIRRGSSTGTVGSGTQTDDTGIWTPTAPGTDTASETTIYDGFADVQDLPQIVARDAAGQVTLTSDGTAYLEDEAKVGLIHPDDLVTIDWRAGGPTDQAVVQKVNHFDGSLFLRRIYA